MTMHIRQSSRTGRLIHCYDTGADLQKLVEWRMHVGHRVRCARWAGWYFSSMGSPRHKPPSLQLCRACASGGAVVMLRWRAVNCARSSASSIFTHGISARITPPVCRQPGPCRAARAPARPPPAGCSCPAWLHSHTAGGSCVCIALA
jgi:hypothetical protein